MSNGHSGYGRTRQKSTLIASVLRDAALLVGEPRSEPVPLETGGSLAAGLGMHSEATTLLRRAKDLEEGIFKVIVYGEFKHGKSTLLNAMLGDRLLPAKTLKCTAIISVLVYGQRDEVQVYHVDQEQPQLFSRDDFTQSFQLTAQDEETLSGQGYVDRFKDIAYAQLECRSPLCANGVRLVDSPGLGDHPSRTRVTTRYMRESHAIIFVLNAMRLLSDDEKYFIRSEFQPGRVGHVFFVVNRVNQINPREVAEVRSYFRDFLKPYYTDEQGRFDEDLYARRVFFVDALGALDLRSAASAASTDTNGAGEALSATGVPALERELELFLTSDEKHSVALTESARALRVLCDEAQQTIRQQQALQAVPLERFEQTIGEVEQHLQKLDRKKREIDRTIKRFGDMVAQKISANLRTYLRELREQWPQDAQMLNLDEVTFGATLAAFFEGFIDKEAAQRRIAEPIKREIERYIQHKTRDWSETRVPSGVQADLETLMREVEEQVVEFKLELERTGVIIAPEIAPDPEQDRERFSQWAHTLIADTLRDILGFEGAVSEWGNWSGVLWRIVQQVVLLYVLVAVSGPVGWAIFAVAQVVQIIWSEQQFRQRLLHKIGEELHTNLANELPRMQQEMYGDVAQQFTRMAGSLTSALQGQIDEKRQELSRIMQQKQDASFSAQQEHERLEQISVRLHTLAALAEQTAAPDAG